MVSYNFSANNYLTKNFIFNSFFKVLKLLINNLNKIKIIYIKGTKSNYILTPNYT